MKICTIMFYNPITHFNPVIENFFKFQRKLNPEYLTKFLQILSHRPRIFFLTSLQENKIERS